MVIDSRPATEIQCPSCRMRFSAEDFLNACRSYWSEVGTVDVLCPCCGADIDGQITAGEIAVGFVYGAGSPHFAAVETAQVEGLRLAKDPNGLRVELGAKTWKIPNSVQ